jgi:hypothetical protein
MVRKTLIAISVMFAVSILAFAADKPNFAGSWTMDRARSFGLPGNMNQTMTVTQKDDQIEVETKLIQPGNERVQKDTYILDGKEHEFTPPVPPNAPAGQPAPKGKRTASWLPGGNGITVTDVTTTETAKGAQTAQTVRKWTLSGQGELVIDMYIDNANGSFEAKRIFKRS